MQDNAGKTTLLYRLKVRDIQGGKKGGMRIWKQHASWVWTRGIRRLITPPDRRGSHNDTNNRLQRRIRHIQEPQFRRLGKFTSLPITHNHRLTLYPPGPRRPNLHPPLLALLLRQHSRRHLRNRQHRHRAPHHRQRRTPRHAQRRRATRRRPPRLRKQTRSTGCKGRGRDQRGAQVGGTQRSELEYCGL